MRCGVHEVRPACEGHLCGMRDTSSSESASGFDSIEACEVRQEVQNKGSVK